MGIKSAERLAFQKRPKQPRKHPTECHNRRQPYNGCAATAGASQDLAFHTAAFCKRLLCGTFGCHDKINFAIKDVKQRDLLSQTLTSVGGVEQSIHLRQRRPQASSEFAAA